MLFVLLRVDRSPLERSDFGRRSALIAEKWI
jgi:hypothetical protein